MTEHDRNMLEEWQVSCEGATERRLKDFLDALDDLRSLASRREGASILKASRNELKQAMRSLHDLYMDTEPADERPMIIHLSELRELRRGQPF
jgi:hypothetical protein